MQRLNEKIAIVTGAAHGIGKEVAEKFAAEGAAVLLVDICPDVSAVARAINFSGGKAAHFRADVSKMASVKKMVAVAKKKFGGVDIVVNNAWSWRKPNQNLEEMDPKEWEYGFRLAMSATLWSAKFAVPLMEKREGQGVILSIASVRGMKAGRGSLAYDALKAGLIHLIRALAVSLGGRGIRVNAISPGMILAKAKLDEIDPEREMLEKNVFPLTRAGLAEEIANAAAFLASDEASYITGHNMVVDGGLTIQLPDDVMSEYFRSGSAAAN